MERYLNIEQAGMIFETRNGAFTALRGYTAQSTSPAENTTPPLASTTTKPGTYWSSRSGLLA